MLLWYMRPFRVFSAHFALLFNNWGLRRLEKNLIHCQLVCSKSNMPCPETEPHPRTCYSNGTYHEVSEEHLIGRGLGFEYGWSWLHKFYSLSWSTEELTCLLVIITTLFSFFAPFLNQMNRLPYFPAHKTNFFPEKCDLNLTCVLCAEGKYYFQTYKYLYIYYITSLSWDSEICFQIIRSGITACERLTFL
jgi:hypothetical protein